MSLQGPSLDLEEGNPPLEEEKTLNDDESLLNLVMPELVSLSRCWLAALKDHALLSLPPGI